MPLGPRRCHAPLIHIQVRGDGGGVPLGHNQGGQVLRLPWRCQRPWRVANPATTAHQADGSRPDLQCSHSGGSDLVHCASGGEWRGGRKNAALAPSHFLSRRVRTGSIAARGCSGPNIRGRRSDGGALRLVAPSPRMEGEGASKSAQRAMQPSHWDISACPRPILSPKLFVRHVHVQKTVLRNCSGERRQPDGVVTSCTRKARCASALLHQCNPVGSANRTKAACACGPQRRSHARRQPARLRLAEAA